MLLTWVAGISLDSMLLYSHTVLYRPTMVLLERWLVPAVFLTVTLIHSYLRIHDGLNPWRGGGFGMFSTVDDPLNRKISAQCVDEEGADYIIDTRSEADTELDPLLEQVRIEPEIRVISQVAQMMMGLTYSKDISGTEGLKVLHSVNASSGAGARLVKIRFLRLTVYRLRFQTLNAAVSFEPLTVYETGRR